MSRQLKGQLLYVVIVLIAAAVAFVINQVAYAFALGAWSFWLGLRVLDRYGANR